MVVGHIDEARQTTLLQVLAAVTGQTDFRTQQSEDATVEQDAVMEFYISLFSVLTGPILAIDIDVSGMTAEMAQSRGGGAFDPTGITVPVFTAGLGQVSCPYQFLSGEWQTGDIYRLILSGVKATVGGDVVYLPDMVWSNLVVEAVTLETTVNTINTNQGDPSGDTLISTTAKLGDSPNAIGPTLDTVNVNQGDPSGDTLISTTLKLGDSPNAIGPTLDSVMAYVQNEAFLFPDNSATRCLLTAGDSVTLTGTIALFAFGVGDAVSGSVSLATGVVTGVGADYITVNTVVGIFLPTDLVLDGVTGATIGTPVIVTDIFSTWAEIVDSNGIKLSAASTAKPMFLDEIAVANYSAVAHYYIIEVAWGVAKTVVARDKVIAASWAAYPMPFFLSLRSAQIPAAELIYYRMMCEEVSPLPATLEANFRYYFIPP
jgi:hypothetical protein